MSEYDNEELVIMGSVEETLVAEAANHALRIRESFEVEMRDVKDGVLRMGSYVEEQILAAHDAIMNRDAGLAEKVIASDARVNEVQRAVSGIVGMTIATQAPVARDLRFLLALDRVTYELERIGDHAGSVAKQARKLAGVTSMVTYDELTPMATLAAQQVRDVVMALIDIDEAKAREVAARDDEIDRLYHQVFDDVLAEMRTDPQKVDPGTRILFAAHYLERIGDRVTNIAEDVVFLATGEVEDLNP
ncbi:MAG TPA: phosphate signaling complex protein PhoU [Terriglobales bacterium]|nr:phosphate signaling complex protein PhoU [Terriglobales bacterium]